MEKKTLPKITKNDQRTPRSTPLGVGLIEFVDASITPLFKGHYLVITQSLEYVYCKASILDDGQFCYFSPQPASDPTSSERLYGSKILAWAKISDPRDVIHTLFN